MTDTTFVDQIRWADIQASASRHVNREMAYAVQQTGLSARTLFRKAYRKARLEENYAEPRMWDEDVVVKLPHNGRIVHIVMRKGAQGIEYCCGTEILDRAKYRKDPLQSLPGRVLRASTLRKQDTDPEYNFFYNPLALIMDDDSLGGVRSAKKAWLDAK